MGDGVIKPEDLHIMHNQLNQTANTLKKDLEFLHSQVETLPENLIEMKVFNQGSEDNAKKEMDVLCQRVKTTATLLSFLKLKAKSMTIPHLAHSSCGIKHQDGVGLIDRNGLPLCDWSKEVDFSSFESSDEETLLVTSCRLGKSDGYDGAYISEVFKSVQMITDVLESLVKRVIMAESEVSSEKEKLNLSREEIKKKTSQISSMSTKVEDMEKFALNTNCVLNEMRQKFEDMVEETSRQRQRHAENEQELSRVKQDFESLKSYVSNLTSVRETLLSSEKQFQTMEKLFERLVAKTTLLEVEKEKKETEIQKLFAENVRLTTLLDKKEAQLLAMNEQCKFMALSKPSL